VPLLVVAIMSPPRGGRYAHGGVARKIIGADPCPLQLRIARAGARAQMPSAGGHRNWALEDAGDVNAGLPKIVMPSLHLDRDQAGIRKPAEMPARGRKRPSPRQARLRSVLGHA
jgi:hypothetical protein